MIQPNYIEKALVPYLPPKRNKFANSLNLLFSIRGGSYLLFIELFFIFSAAARCISIYNPGISSLLVNDVDLIKSRKDILPLLKICLPQIYTVSIVFLASFTYFSFPLCLLGSIYSFFSFSFLYFSVIENFTFGFYAGIALLAVYSFMAIVGVLFYTESIYSKTYSGTLYKAMYIMLYFLYTITIFVLYKYMFSII